MSYIGLSTEEHIDYLRILSNCILMKKLIRDGYVVCLSQDCDYYYLGYLLQTLFNGNVYRDDVDDSGNSQSFLIPSEYPLTEEEINELNYTLEDLDFEGEFSFEGAINCHAEERGIQVVAGEMYFFYLHDAYEDLITVLNVWNTLIEKKRSVLV